MSMRSRYASGIIMSSKMRLSGMTWWMLLHILIRTRTMHIMFAHQTSWKLMMNGSANKRRKRRRKEKWRKDREQSSRWSETKKPKPCMMIWEANSRALSSVMKKSHVMYCRILRSSQRKGNRCIIVYLLTDIMTSVSIRMRWYCQQGIWIIRESRR